MQERDVRTKWPRRQARAPGQGWSLGLHILVLAGVLWVGGCAWSVPVFGLRPEYPPVRRGSAEVDSLQPTLRWQAFPDPKGVEVDREGVLGRVQDVTYELRIGRAEDDLSAEVVYARDGILTPAHTLEEPLQPSTKYFWTIRARFELDGQVRVTEWGTTSRLARRLVPVPNFFSFRFKTPPD